TQMIGRRPAELPDRPQRAYRAEHRLRVRDLSLKRQFSDVSFDVELGAVVGVAGLEDAGIRPLMRTIFGFYTPDEGSVELPDTKRRPSSATAAVRAGVAYVPADRRVGGLMLEQSITENVCQVTAGVLRDFGPVLSRRAMRASTKEQCAGLAVKTSSIEAPAASLSGGNQQKVVLAKWLAADPRVFLLDDPTRGVDIGAKLEIYDQVRKLAEQGRAVLFHSSELAEYEYTCQRVLIMRRGRIVGELSGEDIAEARLLHAINRDAADAVPV
ncbi:MAG TPA: ATP-binding cassette domain-containing protein, partial [Solirubrobacteraceae bacterium]|nr:ATP-binding cassette domain-containing protein [Solirubrobacteraceae bacterium]